MALAAEEAEDLDQLGLDRNKRAESMLLSNNKAMNNPKTQGHSSVLANYNKGSLPPESSGAILTSPLSLTKTQMRQERAK